MNALKHIQEKNSMYTCFVICLVFYKGGTCVLNIINIPTNFTNISTTKNEMHNTINYKHVFPSPTYIQLKKIAYKTALFALCKICECNSD